MAPLSRSQTQVRGLCLILLLFGQEIQAVSAATEAARDGYMRGDRSERRREWENRTDEVNFAVPPPDVDRLAQHGGEGSARSLLAVGANWQWPAQTTLKFTNTNIGGDNKVEESATEVTLLAGLLYHTVEIKAAGTTFGTSHDQAKIKLVSNLADRTKCEFTTYDIPVGLITRQNGAPDGSQALLKVALPLGAGVMGNTKGPLSLERTASGDAGGGEKLGKSTGQGTVPPGEIVFMYGGLYKLCYTPDGSFGGGDDTEYKNNVLNTNIKVLGVTSPCTTPRTDGCIESERWECSFGYKGEYQSHCVFNLKPDGGRKPDWAVTPGGKSKMTWSPHFLADTGAVQNPKICGQLGEEPEKSILDTATTGLFLKLDGIADPTSMPPVKSTYVEAAFTVAACYCPNYDAATGTYCGSETSSCCDQYQEYIQNFGRIYFWTIRICDKLNFGTTCRTTPYMRVVPQQKFVLRVDCPPGGGCQATSNNRVKFIEYKIDNDRPAWDSNHGCKTTVGETGRAVWPTISDSKSLSGGANTLFKSWDTKQVKFNVPLKWRVDVCYCNDQCENPKYWFRIGAVESASAFAFSRRIATGSTTYAIKYVNEGGSVTLFGGITSSGATRNPYDSNMYSGKALLNVISYDRDKLYGIGDLKKTLEDFQQYDKIMPANFHTSMDAECQRENYQPTLVAGPWSKLDAKAYIAKVDAVDDTISRYLTFSGELQNRQLTIARAGVVAICYCALLSAQDACLDPAYWVYAGRTTIHGPIGGQSWVFPTNIIVKIELQGWGFTANDKLRIVPATSSCSNNLNNPESDEDFKIGCPSTQPPAVGELGCRYAATTTSIPLNVLTSQTSGATISAVATSPTQSTLSFSKSINNVLDPGDTITLDIGRMENNGKLLSAMTDMEKYDTYQLAATTPYQDDTAVSYMIGHRVSEVKDQAGMVNNQQLTIPVGWPSSGGPAFTFLNSQGYWTRHNRIETPLTIKGVTGKEGLKVCWGVHDGGTKFYAEAGLITFTDPPEMKAKRINLSTKARGEVAPIVVSFTTFPQLTAYAAAKNAETTLMLRFNDISESNGKLIPRFSGDAPPDTPGPGTIGDSEEILEIDKRQWVCGRLFNELWTKDTEGFPMPSGCYFGKKLKDNVEKGIQQKFFRELYISFPAGSGLKQNTDYQIVVNAMVKDILAGENLLDLYSLCVGRTGCARPYQVFEKGTTTASSGTESAATYADPSFNTQGFMIQRGDPSDALLDLSTMNILQVKLRGLEDNAAIQKNCNLRIYLWPLTLWELGTGCSAECRAYHANNKKCDGSITCTTEDVVIGSGRKNIVRLKLPADMHDITGTTQHTVKITGLTLPVAGFFASRVGAQVTRPDDTKPSYTTSFGFLMKKAETGQTTGRLVLSDRTGYGPKPFAADTGNTLFLRLSFGATVWNNGQADAAYVEIVLPDGYSCAVPDDGSPDLTLPVFGADLDNDGYYDSNRGSLSVFSADGTWGNSAGKRCIYQPRQYNAIFAGMVAFVKVTVNNPGTPLQKMDENNIWSIKLSCKGANTIRPSAADMNEQTFISLAEERALGVDYWAGNAAVLSSLVYETLQPTDFRRSTATHTDSQYVHVFFRTTQYVGRNGYVILDAPDGYDFGTSCLAMPLPMKYYSFRGAAYDQVFMLRSMAQCTGLRSPATATTYNRARVVVGGIIGRQLFYGFRIRVQHPSVYKTSQHDGWYIWTQDSNRYGLEGSTSTVKFNKKQSVSQVEFYHKSYGMYNGAFFDSFHIEIQGMQPKTITATDSDVTVYPITFDKFTDTSLRITAPSGYVWTATAASFIPKMNMSTMDFPLNPTYENENQLVWPKVEFANDHTYGFQAKIRVPDFGPVTASDNFFVEFGFNRDNINERLMAAILPAPRVRTMTNCAVSYGSNLQSYTTNFIEFRFETVTLLWENEGIVIKGDANTMGFAFSCPPRMLDDSAKFPSDMKCIAVESAADNLPQVVLKTQATPVAPGYYKFELSALNPTRKILIPGNWKFGSYKTVSEYPNSPPIDNALLAPGFSINGPIFDARLITLNTKQIQATKRNDRPNKANQLIFRFQLRQTPPAEAPLLLRGPRGFVFEEDCLKSVITAKNYVFGANTESTWPPDLSNWPGQFAPVACIGEGRFATITIPAGLGRRNMYVFRIGIVKNPDKTPLWNKWTIDYKQESSEPFEGFTVWTFTETKVTPVSLAKSPTGANVARTINPVEVKFRPYNRIPFKCPSCATGGLLRVTAPNRFEFVQNNGECNAMLFETNLGAMAGGFPSVDLRCSVSPTLRTKLFLEIIGGTQTVEGGRDYTMIVEVYNPSVTDQAEQWALDSFNSKASANINNDQIALDESVIPGSEINNVLNIWTVNNKYKRYNGKTKVNDVEITMQFPDALKDGDEIFVRGPLNFDLEGNPELKDCKEFRWPPNTNPLPNSGFPTCICGSGVCQMRFFIREYKDPAYPQNQNINFFVATQNPSKTPFVTQNFWRVEHMRSGMVKSAHVYPSWNINPQLEEVAIELVGPNQRASSESDLTFSFKPVSDAGTIKIEALFPTEFDFGQATVLVPYDIDDRSEREIIIINRANILSGRMSTIKISSVKLGRGGGQTRFNLITYADETMREKRDEKLEYTGGFRLPGKVDVSGKTLKSRYQDERQLFPVKSLFQARVSELAKAEFILMFSQPVMAAQTLIITCLGDGAYELRSAPFVIIGKERVDTSVERTAGKLTELLATLRPGRPSTEVAMQADTPYTVIFWTIPKSGTNNWRFMTSDSLRYPTNTNDGITTGFKPVEQMGLTVATPRSPPRAIIKVTLNVNPRSAVVLELLIIAPPAFIFPPTGCGTMCQAGQALGATMRRTATIASPTGEPLTSFNGLEINIQTPEETPGGAQSWFVEARGQGRGTTTGWGEGAGFRVNQMVSGVAYSGVSSLRSAQISFHFTLLVDAGSEIAVEPPTNYILSCSTEGALKQGSLPGGRPGCTDEPLVLMLSTTLTRGEYSFAVAVDLPATKSIPNNFNIIIRDRDNRVVDAAYSLAGVDLFPVPVLSPTISWSRAEPGQNSIITIGITFSSDYNQVKALLITFPKKFIHAILRPTDVQNLNRRFPVAASQAHDLTFKDKIKIYLDDSDDATVIARDTYSWSFPVLVPVDNVPNVNVWYFSLCSERTCETPKGRGTIVSFPMQGFALGEVSPATMKSEASHARPRHGGREAGLARCALSALFALLISRLDV